MIVQAAVSLASIPIIKIVQSTAIIQDKENEIAVAKSMFPASKMKISYFTSSVLRVYLWNSKTPRQQQIQSQ